QPVRSWLDPKISWAWEEAIAAGRAIQTDLPAVVWADRDLYEFGPYRWGLNPWRAAASSPRTIFADAHLRAMQRATFDELLRRFGSAAGVQEWRVALTLPLEGETGLVDCYCGPAPAGTQVLISHPASMGEREPIWQWQSGAAQWRYPAGWDSLFNPRRYPSLAPEVTTDFVLLTADSNRGQSGQSPAARLVLHANPLSKTGVDRFADNLATGAYLDIDLETVGRGADGRLAVDIVTGDWLRYHVLSPELLPGNQRKRVRIALGDDSPLTPVQSDLMPGLVEKAVDPAAYAWRASRMRRIREVVLSYFRTDGPVQVRLYRMTIRPTRPGDAATPPSLTALTMAPPEATPAGQLLEFDANIVPTPVNPYDIEAVDLRLAATDEKGQTIEVPAYWFEPFERRTHKITIGAAPVEAEEMALAGLGRFRARLRLREAGSYRLSWRLYKGSHFETTSTKVYDNRYTADGEALPFPSNNYMEKMIQADERVLARKDGPQLYGTAEANRTVSRVRFVTGTAAADAGAGTVKVGAPAGAPIKYVRVSKADPNTFEFDDGSFFYPVGVNARSPSDARVPFKPTKDTLPYDDNFFAMLDKRATYQFDDFFQAYATHGINWARVWMSSWWLALEWRRDYPGYGGVGDYNQIHAARLDHLLAEAEKNGVYVQLTLNNHGMYSPEIDTQWADNPYNKALGGPCASMMDFFSQAEAQKDHLARLRYVVARWGQSPAIHAWEILSEVEFVGEYAPHYADFERGLNGRKAEVLDGWHREVADWLKQWDVQGHHIVTTHYSHSYQGQSTLAMKEMEVPMANAYSAYPDLYNGKDPDDNCQASVAADAYWNGFRDANSAGNFAGFKQYHKPVLIGEHGRHWMGVDMRYKVGTPNTPANLLADMHCMLWAQYMRPYAGDTGFWWWLPLHFEKGWLDHYAAFGQFIAGEDRRGLTADGQDGTTDREAIGSMAFYDPAIGRGFAWVFEKSLQQDLKHATVQSGAKWTLDLKKPGKYELEFWHTLAGGAGTPGEALKYDTKTVTVAAGQTKLELALPDFNGDFALKIRRVPDEKPR
ncbi:MAG TPA: hypothetical protein VL860_13280, partial [Planctomycetota bacterium]|nr:hypothetical protein [Planctomycetota bacterium]